MGIIGITALILLGAGIGSGVTTAINNNENQKQMKAQMEFDQAIAKADRELREVQRMFDAQYEAAKKTMADTRDLEKELQDIIGKDGKPNLRIVK